MPIRVLLVDDSPFALAVLKRMLADAPGIEIAGTAANGREGLEQVKLLRPDVICSDLVMPVMDGLAFTREVTAHHPTPILVVSSTIQPEERGRSYPILAAGAIDVFPKPASTSGPEFAAQSRELAAKIRVLAGVRVIRKQESAAGEAAPAPGPARPAWSRPVRVVAIGASTGGPVVLKEILSALPATYPLPILCVQHISPGFLDGFVEWLGRETPLPVRLADAGQEPRAGTVYFAREGSHLALDGGGRLAAPPGPGVEGHVPSATVLFESVARQCGGAAAGVLLTGMGSDGAAGMLAIERSGGLTVAQDQASCAVWGMPAQAVALGAARYQLPPAEIARLLGTLRAA